MSASFAYEDPLLRQQTQAGMKATQKAREIFKEMGRGMWSSGKGFGKVGALFAGIECVIESVRLNVSLAFWQLDEMFFLFSTEPKMIFITLSLQGFWQVAFWLVVRAPRLHLVVVWPLRHFHLQ